MSKQKIICKIKEETTMEKKMSLEEVLNQAMRESFINDKYNKVIDPERLAIFNKVCNDFAELFDAIPKISMHPSFCSAGVTVNLCTVDLTSRMFPKFAEILSYCSTFEVVPKLDGSIDVAVNVQHVFKDIDE